MSSTAPDGDGLAEQLDTLAIDGHPGEEPGEEEGEDEEEGEAEQASPALGNKKVVCKLLVSNAAAGSIIGKGGASISDLQSQSGARLQLSRATDFFPGTNERVMLASGKVDSVLTAIHLILTKIDGEASVKETMLARDGKSKQLHMLVPAALCGTIIGKGGAAIREMAADSKAQITVSPQDKQPAGVPDRIVRVTGETESLLRAFALLLGKLCDNPNYARFVTNTVYYSNGGQQQQHPPPQQAYMDHRGPPGMGGYGGPQPGSGPPGGGANGQALTEVTIPVPESRVGAVIGKGGEVISQLKTVVGVRIRISDREDFVPGTRNRKVTIIGNAEAVRIAEVLIQQKINQAAPLVQ